MSEKRSDILRAALTEFAQEGYLGASIDAIAARAAVSTRTIYNHFRDKEQLFQVVIEESSGRVADSHIALMVEHLRDPTDLESALLEFALAWITPSADSAEHFALIRRVQVERSQLPKALLDAWRTSGPLRVKQALANHLTRFADDGLIHLEDPQRAALQFASLISHSESWVGGASRASSDDLRAAVVSSVRLFLYGCASKRPLPRQRVGKKR